MAAVRQIAHRAREHLAARRPRMQVDRAQQQAAVEKAVAFPARAAKVPDFVAATAWLNGIPGARIDIGGPATAVSLVVEDGRVTRIYAIRNPHKLGWLEKVAELRR